MELVFRYQGLFPIHLIDRVNCHPWRGWKPRACKIMAIDYDDGVSTVVVQVRSRGWDCPIRERHLGLMGDFDTIDFGTLSNPAEKTILIEQRLQEERFSRN